VIRTCARRSAFPPLGHRQYGPGVGVGERRRHAGAFGTAAAAYAEHRPGYARDAVRWALEPALGPRVLDLGAGTGKLTAALVEEGADVVADVPDPAMLEQLRSAVPGVRALAGSAETVPLPDASVDVVVAGNALHWFDPSTAGPELARVLVPGGVLAGLWNVVDDRVDWVADLVRVGGGEVFGRRDALSTWRPACTAHLPVTGFGRPDHLEVPHGQRRTAESLVATLATRAGVLVLPPDERAVLLGRLRAQLASRPETAVGGFDLPMLTCVLRTRRT